MSLLPPLTYTQSLKDLDREELIQRLYKFDLQQDQPPGQAKGKSTAPQGKSTAPLDCMSTKDIVSTLHHPDTSPPAIRPCDTPNASATKSHFTAEELHRLMGCRRFRNYRHLIHTSKDGQFLDNGEFPASIGAYTTIPKAPRGKLIDRTPSKYLDIVHIDIAFGICLAVISMLSSLWIGLPVSIIVSGSSCFIMMMLSRLFSPFALRLGTRTSVSM